MDCAKHCVFRLSSELLHSWLRAFLGERCDQATEIAVQCLFYVHNSVASAMFERTTFVTNNNSTTELKHVFALSFVSLINLNFLGKSSPVRRTNLLCPIIT